MEDIKMIKCDGCNEWYSLDKIEHPYGLDVCHGCGRVKITCTAKCPENDHCGIKHCTVTKLDVFVKEVNGRDYCPCGNIPEWVETTGHHDEGIGCNPNGVFCGECSKITCKGCVNEYVKPYEQLSLFDK